MMTLAKLNRVRNNHHTPDYYGGVLNTFFNDFAYPTTAKRSIATNVVESDEAYKLELAIPGFNKENVEVKLEADTLTIIGKAKEEEKELNYTRREFKYGEFEKAFTLPDTVDVSKINASFKDGILSFDLPKKEPAKPVSININVE